MKIKFKNGNILEPIESADSKRSKRAAIYYYRKNPYEFYEFIEDFCGVKLRWYQRLWIWFNIFTEEWRQLWKM